MIKALPPIYSDESAYSYICRLYARSGFIWRHGFVKEVFRCENECTEYDFIFPLNAEFKKVLTHYIPIDRLLLEHTLFPYHVRFLPKDKRIQAYEYALKNEPTLHKYLPMPSERTDNYLKYCPVCIKEDRQRYGECYYHVAHLFPTITVCPHHKCKLVSTGIRNKNNKQTNLVPLEQVISIEGIRAPEYYEEDNINFLVARYLNDILAQPLNLKTDILIGDYLTNRLSEKYLTPRGSRKDLELLTQDVGSYFNNLDISYLSKQRLAMIYRNQSWNAYDISLLAMFEGITPAELCSYSKIRPPRHIAFDEKVKELRSQYKSIEEIADTLGVCSDVVRKVLSGYYVGEQNDVGKVFYNHQDWETIDEDCCKRFDEFIQSKPANITRATAAAYFGIDNKCLGCLPRLRKMVADYRATHKTIVFKEGGGKYVNRDYEEVDRQLCERFDEFLAANPTAVNVKTVGAFFGESTRLGRMPQLKKLITQYRLAHYPHRDWEAIDEEYCKRFCEFIASNPARVSLYSAAEYFGEERHFKKLPKIKKMILDYRQGNSGI